MKLLRFLVACYRAYHGNAVEAIYVISRLRGTADRLRRPEARQARP